MVVQAFNNIFKATLFFLFCSALTWTPIASANDWQWIKDMPTVADVEAAIQGENLEQTLGWQCAVYSNLITGKHLPATYSIAPPPEAQALVTELKNTYRQAIANVRQRYDREVKSLEDAEHARQFTLVCGADGSHVDNTGRRVSPSVPDAALAKLFKPSVLEVYQKQLQITEDKHAAYKTKVADQQQATRDTIWFAFIWLGGMILSIIIGAWCLVKAFRLSRELQLARMDRTNAAGVQEFEDTNEFDAIQQAEAMKKLQLKILVPIGGFLLILGPFLVSMLVMLE